MKFGVATTCLLELPKQRGEERAHAMAPGGELKEVGCHDKSKNRTSR